MWLNLDYNFEPPEWSPESDIDFTQWNVAWAPWGGGVDFGFHAENCYIEIQKILINSTKTSTGATVLFDFALPEVHGDESGTPYWWANFWGDGFISDGLYKHTAEGGYAYGGGFASGQTIVYIGFVFRTNTVSIDGVGNFRFMKVDHDTILLRDMEFEVLE
jgi:hypothetical protein